MVGVGFFFGWEKGGCGRRIMLSKGGWAAGPLSFSFSFLALVMDMEGSGLNLGSTKDSKGGGLVFIAWDFFFLVEEEVECVLGSGGGGGRV